METLYYITNNGNALTMAKIIQNSNQRNSIDKVVDQQKYSQKVVEQFTNASIDQYSQFLNEIPVFVNYYQKDHFRSGHDRNLNSVHEIMGDNSPIIFNKMEGFPLYKMTKIDLSVSDGPHGGEVGMAQFTAMVLPNILEPIVDDLITIWYENEENVFRVNEVQRNRIEGKAFYQISAYLYKRDQDHSRLKNQVHKTFEVCNDYKTLSEINLIEKEFAIDINDVNQMKRELIEYYRAFYDKRINQFQYKLKDGSGSKLKMCGWDWQLNNFAFRFQLFTDKKNLRGEFFIDNVNVNKVSEIHDYKKSIFYKIENRIPGPIDYDQIIIFDENILDFRYQKDIYKRFDQATIRMKTDLATNNPAALPHTGINDPLFFPSYIPVVDNIHQYIIRTEQNLTINGNISPYVTIIDKFLNKKLTLKILMDLFKLIQFKETIADYYFIPAIIYIMEYMVDEIASKGVTDFQVVPDTEIFMASMNVGARNSPGEFNVKSIPDMFNTVNLVIPYEYIDGTSCKFMFNENSYRNFPDHNTIKDIHQTGKKALIHLSEAINIDSDVKYKEFVSSYIAMNLAINNDGIQIQVPDASLLNPSTDFVNNTNPTFNNLVKFINEIQSALPGHIVILTANQIEQTVSLHNREYTGSEGNYLALYDKVKSKVKAFNVCIKRQDVRQILTDIPAGASFEEISMTNGFVPCYIEIINRLMKGCYVSNPQATFYKTASIPHTGLMIQFVDDLLTADEEATEAHQIFFNIYNTNNILLPHFNEFDSKNTHGFDISEKLQLFINQLNKQDKK